MLNTFILATRGRLAVTNKKTLTFATCGRIQVVVIGGYVLYRYSGGSWLKAHLKKFNGTEFVNVNLKIRVNSQWEDVDCNG